MYEMRYPRVFSEAEEKFLGMKEHASPAISIAGLPPSPSLSGLSFAACAATLPLLLRRDFITLTAASDLLLSKLPYVLEPKAQTSNSKLLEIECLRLQHLFNRVEQVCGHFLSGHNFCYHFVIIL